MAANPSGKKCAGRRAKQPGRKPWYYRAPELYDLRDSGSIEQDADIVMMLETDDAIEPTTGLHDINIWLRKNRQYKKDICIKVRPNKTYSHFDEISVETPEVVTEEVAEDDDNTDDDKLF